MPSFNPKADGNAKGRDHREPQITKADLLASPREQRDRGRPDSSGDKGAFDAQWPFKANPSPASRYGTFPSAESRKRQLDPSNDPIEAAAKRHQPYQERTRETVAQNNVIDLAGSSDDDSDTPTNTNPIVPSHVVKNQATTPSRPSVPSTPNDDQPMSFRRGLSPPRAHPKAAPIVHKNKPPIKPSGHVRPPLRSSPGATGKFSLFKKGRTRTPGSGNVSTAGTPAVAAAPRFVVAPEQAISVGSSTPGPTQRGAFIDLESSDDGDNFVTPGPRAGSVQQSANIRRSTPRRLAANERSEASKRQREEAQKRAQVAEEASPDQVVRSIEPEDHLRTNGHAGSSLVQPHNDHEDTSHKKRPPARLDSHATAQQNSQQTVQQDQTSETYAKPGTAGRAGRETQPTQQALDSRQIHGQSVARLPPPAQADAVPTQSRPNIVPDAGKSARANSAHNSQADYRAKLAADARYPLIQSQIAEAAKQEQLQRDRENTKEAAAAAALAQQNRKAREHAEKQVAEEKRRQEAKKQALEKQREPLSEHASWKDLDLARSKVAWNSSAADPSPSRANGTSKHTSQGSVAKPDGTGLNRERPAKAAPAKGFLQDLKKQTKEATARRGDHYVRPVQQHQNHLQRDLAEDSQSGHGAQPGMGSSQPISRPPNTSYASGSSFAQEVAPSWDVQGGGGMLSRPGGSRPHGTTNGHGGGTTVSKPEGPSAKTHDQRAVVDHRAHGNQSAKPITDEERRLLAPAAPKAQEPPLHSRFAGFHDDNSRSRARPVHHQEQPLVHSGVADQTPAKLQLPNGVPTGPRSLNNAVLNGTLKEAKSNPPPAPDPHRPWALPYDKPRPKTVNSSVFRPQAVDKHGNDRRLGEVSVLDLQLVKWRNEDVEWSEVIRRQQAEYGHERKEDASRKRFRQVQFAIDMPEVTREMIEAAIGGDASARDEINDMLRQQGLDQSNRMPTAAESRAIPRKFSKAGASPDITLADLQLCSWRDADQLQWSAVLDLNAQATGSVRSEGTLRSHYRAVTEALSIPEIEPKLIMEAMNESPEGVAALAQINQLVRQSGQRHHPIAGPRPYANNKGIGGASAVKKQESSVDVKPVKPLQNQPRRTTGAKRPPSEWNRPVSPESRPASPVVAQSLERHTEGGKTMNWKTYNAYLEHLNEAINPPEESSEEEDEAMTSPITDADFCHYAYQVERRECTHEQAEEENRTIDDYQWVACGEAFDNLRKANHSATIEIGQVRPGHPSLVPEMGRTTLGSEKDKYGLAHLELTSSLGTIQVQVTRYMRTWHDRIPPTSKEGWAPKDIFFVKVRVVNKPPGGYDEDLFGEAPRADTEPRTVGKCFGDLRDANECAIKEWLDLTLTFNHINLTMRTIERNDAAKKLTDELVSDMDEGVVSAFTKRIEDGRKVVEVWVAEGEFCGPRNIF